MSEAAREVMVLMVVVFEMLLLLLLVMLLEMMMVVVVMIIAMIVMVVLMRKMIDVEVVVFQRGWVRGPTDHRRLNDGSDPSHDRRRP